MTYTGLYHKAVSTFDGGKKRVTGYPVEVLFNLSRLADAQGWDQQVDTDRLRTRLSPDYLDAHSVATVLRLVM